MTVHPAECRLDLPERAGSPEVDSGIAFLPSEAAPNVPFTRLRAGRRERTVEEDATTGKTTVTIHRDSGAFRLEEHGLTVDAGAVERISQIEGDPLSTTVDIEWRYAMSRGDWAIRTISRTIATCSREAFRLHITLDAYEGDRRVFTKNWSRDLPRVGM